jgi:Fic family protein
MPARSITQYDAPHQFEPLLPSEATMAPLLERANDLQRAAVALGAASGQLAQQELRGLLRSMNSYYTNRIEGEHTRPSDIERALQKDYSSNADLARRQRLAVAHIQAEARCEARLAQGLVAERAELGDKPANQQAAHAAQWLYEPPSLQWLHRELFGALPADELRLSDGSAMTPGEFRTRGVAVGRHEAPAWASLGAFLARWSQVYGGMRRGEASIVAFAAAHHRLTWMHPFLDGNGRVARLHTHLLTHALGLAGGLWSPLRGFARTADRYKALLQAADEHRRGDLDGRGNLSQAALVEWIGYVLDTCIDQVTFMAQQLDVTGMRERMLAALTFEAAVVKSGVRPQALIPLHYLFATQGTLGRAEFKTLMGLGDRVATATIAALLARGFVASDTPYGALRFAVPHHALRFYFPALWPEAEQEQAQGRHPG